MKRCPPLQTWLDLKEGRLSPEESARLEEHRAAGCPECNAQWEWVQRVITGLPGAGALRLSAESRDYLRELAAARLATRQRPSWIAQLFFDSRQQPLLAGARGDSDALQLRYRSAAGEIRLWGEAASPEGWYLIGQVFSKSGDDFLIPEAATLIGEGEHAAARYDARQEDTEFHLSGVRSGIYRLELRLPEMDVLIPEIVLE